jgi:hypothetical protein
MTSIKERYFITWFYRPDLWDICSEATTYDEAIKKVNKFKDYDKKHGKEYKYRIIKQTIQEEVVYNEL